MRFVFNLLAMLVVALGTGFGLSYMALSDTGLLGGLHSGPWVAWPDVGTPNPNPYTRAHLARQAKLQLGQSEGLQFVASTDGNGVALDLACTYHLSGFTPVATLWTLVALDPEGINLARPGTSGWIGSNQLSRNEDGSFTLYIGSRLEPHNWLEVGGSGPFVLSLTLYDTVAASGLSSAEIAMPTVTRVQCS
ncbi:DUF1214 domain-containing protein [Devosia rhodophyticola]|uniref:DUF1214 domain-containing protein n=1 Tax=Devosia rhodophyticola TaxID=3026423 RepID=A0ABY7YZV0_9HYPH|nr:DUF1214 domain-containing protein [Devosia rhodophyticola]WDR06414.1 DUF1214 domain-containing protein [Devosia rhodophyticola]